MNTKSLYKKISIIVICIIMVAVLAVPMSADASTKGNGATLKVAFYPLTGFFEYDDNGQEVGYGVDFLNMISMYTGIHFEYVKADSRESTKQMLMDGKADIRMPGTLPSSPSTTLEYTEQSVIDTYYAVMTLKNRKNLYYEDYDQFKKLRIGVSQGLYDTARLADDLAEENITEKNLVFYDGYNECREALAKGEIDALVSNIMDLDNEMKQLSRFAKVSNYITMAMDSPYLERINDAIAVIKLNEPAFMSDSYKRWFPERIAVPFTREEMTYISSVDSINFSFRNGQGYLTRKNKDGEFEGFYPSLAKVICDKIGVKYEQYDESDNGAANQAVLLDVYYDHVWAENVGLAITQPYFAVNYYEITRKNDAAPDRKSCKVAAIKRFRVTQDYISHGYRDEQMLWCENYEECIDAVSDKKADITYVNSYAAEYYLNLYRYTDLSSTLTGYSHQVCIGVAGDEREILSNIMEKVLSTMTNDELNALMVEITSQQPAQDLFIEWTYENPLRSILLVSGLFILLIVIIALSIFNSRTRKQNVLLMDSTNAKQDFLSRMSHDMRTPMNAIIGFSSFGKETEDLDEAKEYHSKINQSGKYLLQLINDSLDLNKLESGKYVLNLEPYWNRDFDESIENILRPKAEEKGVEFVLRNQTVDPVALMFDKVRLQQIFVNLINNAIKFTPKGGHVLFSIESENAGGKERVVHFTVTDDGIGMSEEYQREKLFEPFEQENFHGGEEGTGLGLAIVKDLVDAMGGTITCHSKLGEGTTFDIYIKTDIAENVEKIKRANEISIDNLQGKRILMCEDHPLNREIMEKILEKAGMIVDSASDGKQGLDMFEGSSMGYYFAILMDIRMPVMDGLTATKAIRKLEREDAQILPIIALSANAFREDVADCIDAGMNEHLAKPIDPQLLYRTLLKYVDR